MGIELFILVDFIIWFDDIIWVDTIIPYDSVIFIVFISDETINWEDCIIFEISSWEDSIIFDDSDIFEVSIFWVLTILIKEDSNKWVDSILSFNSFSRDESSL